MVYMVEMALLETGRRAEWDGWYVAHQHRLLSIPGFRPSQRFEAIHTVDAPFVALHEVDSPEIFASHQAVMAGRHELLPRDGVRYVAALAPSGAGPAAFTLARA